MKSLFVSLSVGLMIAGGLFAPHPRQAEAKKSYWQEFEKRYTAPQSANPARDTLREAIGADRCDVCHAGSKKKFNAYGTAIRKAPKPRRSSKSTQMHAAFGHAAQMKSRPGDPDSLTFGELLLQGKLPVEK